ncbi:MAG: hypothetical protein ACE5R6_06045 [Candidatus Heimdallarchaeota archaeon]
MPYQDYKNGAYMIILSDDLGSIPLPNDVNKNTYTTGYFHAVEKIGQGSELTNDSSSHIAFNKICRETMRGKLETGLDIVTYPQMGVDMITQFLKPIREHPRQSSPPYLIDEKYAVIPQLVSINPELEAFSEVHGEIPKLKVCITGPIELYLHTEVGRFVSEDLLMNIAESVRTFVKQAFISVESAEINVVSIDEPSLGLRDLGMWDEDTLISALQKATDFKKNITTQIHMHSLNSRHIPLQVEGINVLTCEYAGNPTQLKGVGKEEFEKYDKFLRVGIARTDIDAINLELHEKGIKNGFNRIKKGELPASIIVEDPSIMIKRLKMVYKQFRDRLFFAGPDCGFGKWPTQEAALVQLSRTVSAISQFRRVT